MNKKQSLLLIALAVPLLNLTAATAAVASSAAPHAGQAVVVAGDSLADRHAAMRTQLDAADAKLRAANDANRQAIALLSQKVATIAELEAARAANGVRIGDLEAQLVSVGGSNDAERAALQSELAEARAANSSLGAQLDATHRIAAALEVEKADLQQCVADREQQLARMREGIDRAEVEVVAELGRRDAAAAAATAARQSAAHALRATAGLLRDDLTTLKAEVSDKRAAFNTEFAAGLAEFNRRSVAAQAVLQAQATGAAAAAGAASAAQTARIAGLEAALSQAAQEHRALALLGLEAVRADAEQEDYIARLEEKYDKALADRDALLGHPEDHTECHAVVAEHLGLIADLDGCVRQLTQQISALRGEAAANSTESAAQAERIAELTTQRDALQTALDANGALFTEFGATLGALSAPVVPAAAAAAVTTAAGAGASAVR